MQNYNENKIEKKENNYNSFYHIVKELYNEELANIESDLDIELKNKETI